MRLGYLNKVIIMDECSVLNINSDFKVKLEIFKDLIEDYERELYEIIINE